MEHFSPNAEKSYTSISAEELEALSVEEKKTAYTQLIAFWKKRMSVSPNDLAYFQAEEKVDEYEAQLAQISPELAE